MATSSDRVPWSWPCMATSSDNPETNEGARTSPAVPPVRVSASSQGLYTVAAMDPATSPSPAPRPTLNGQSANPFDWRAFWKAADAGAVIEVAHVTFDRESDAGQLARLRSRVFKERVRFVDCRFHALVDLAMARFEKSLYLVDCTFEQGLSLRDVDVRSRLSLRGSTMRDDARFWLDWRGLRVGADMSLIGATAYAPIDLYNATIGQDLRLDGLHALTKGKATEEVAKNQTLGVIDRNHVAREMVGKAINLEGGEIGRNVIAYPFNDRSTTIKGQFDLRARVTGQVQFSNSVVDAGTGGTAVDLESATIGDSVFFMDGTRITGAVDLRAKVTGQVSFNNAVVDAGTGGTAVDMAEAAIGGSVFFQNGTRITGAVDLRAKVAGQVAFTNAVVDAGTGGLAVNMWSAEVGSSVFFVDGTRITGAVDFRANVTGQVAFLNAVVDAGGAPNTIAFESADIGGTCFLRERTLFIGSINFLKARLRGGLTCSDIFDQTTFDRPGSGGGGTPRQCLCITGGIDLDFAEAHGPVVLHGVGIGGNIRARHLTVHGDLHLCGGVAGTVDKASTEARDAFVEHYRTLHTAHLAALKARDQADTPTAKLDEAVEKAHSALEDHLSTILPREWEDWEYEFPEIGWQDWDTASSPADATQTALDLELADIHGHVWIKGTRVLGTVRLDDAEIVGEANFEKAMIHGDLLMRSASVRGRVFADEKASDGPCPQVTGTVDARGARLAQVSISLVRSDGDTIPQAIVMSGSTVDSFEVRGRPPEGPGKRRFNMHRMNFAGLDVSAFICDRPVSMSMRDWLRIGAFVGLIALAALVLHLGGSPPGSVLVSIVIGVYFLIACGLAMPVLAPLTGHAVRKPVLDFLDHTKFSAAFYLGVERWARARGNDPLADEVFLSRRKRELIERRARMAGTSSDQKKQRVWHDRDFTWFWRYWVIEFLFGYGVRPGRVVHLYLLLWLLNWAVFLPAFSVERPLSFEVAAETDSAAAQGSLDERQKQAHVAGTPNLWPGEGGRPGPEDHWGAQRAFFMALRLQIPLVDLFVDKPWKPADRAMFAGGEKTGGWHLTYENYAAAMRAINLILLPVVIAGAAGFLKPRDRGEHGT
ncbi:MAG: hypothetical protein KF757_06820 [Phycisphaeraceae bacterium]|nr:hypothetical protein [Phycisphaeraceae bacterium]MCW5763317.1 hypothetical protein [Phycisphaeraceae bacterium]